MSQKKGWDLLLRSIERQAPKEKRSRAKSKKPEKETERSVLAWAQKNNIFVHVVESKAVFSTSAGSYLRGQVEAGFPDLVGNNSAGQSLYIELKASGRRSNLSEIQYEFLRTKIDQGCFAVVVDSAELLGEFYYSWVNNKNPKSYLLSLLPKPRSLVKKEQDVDPEFGF